MILQQWLARLFNSHQHHDSTATGTIVQQSLERLINSHWHDYSTATGTIVQQSLARLINSHWHDSSIVAGTIAQQLPARFYFLCWQNSSTVQITVEEPCHVPGIRHMTPISYIISEAHSEHCQASQMVLFAKIVNSCKALIISIKSSIFDVSISKTVH